MMINNNVLIPTMSFRSNSVMYYHVNSNHSAILRKSILFNQNANQLKSRKRYIGQITDGVIKRMRKCITMLLQSTPYQYRTNPVTGKTMTHKLSFITLTIPDVEKAKDAKFCHKYLLQPMLRVLRENHLMKSYIWKAELQENGSIHYHLTCDCVVHHRSLRSAWNSILLRNGMLKDFELKYGHSDPNSTDIHNVRNVRNLESYLVKYICKSYQNEEALAGKVWDASKNIKAADYYKFEVSSQVALLIKTLQDRGQVITRYFEKAISFDFRTSDYYLFFYDNIINDFFAHLKKIQTWVKSEPKANNSAIPKPSPPWKLQTKFDLQLQLNYGYGL